ncbi:MAG: ATP-binding cassette domain-containing protein [Bacteroidales bacterium]|nr:ATP-binding cassette domain-containing protein [Bacteroidales bacterium]MBN2758491.1 ATP-binding cassette domain-containing protein [Bacteroidales bacterium]
MRDFLKVLIPYILPYKLQAFLNIAFNILASIFSLFSLVMIIPFLGILFDPEKLVTIKPAFEYSSEYLLNNFYYFVSQIIIDSGQEKALLVVIVFILLMIFLKNFFSYFANFFMAPLRNGIVKDIRNKIFGKILNLHIGYFSEEKKGDIISRMTTDVQEFEWSAMSSIEMFFRDPILIIIFFSSLIFISPGLTLLIIVLLPLSGIIIGRIGKSLRKKSTEVRSRMGTLLSIMEETIGGLRIIKAFIAEKKVADKFQTENSKYTKVVTNVFRREYLASPLSEFLGVLTLMIVMYYGAAIVLKEESSLSPELFMGYIGIFSQVINPAKALTTAYYKIQKGLAASDRINSIIDTEIEIIDKENAVEIKDFKSEIEFTNVGFKYIEADVLKDINIKIQKGKSIALVGQSGSGKSTLVDLLPRFYDVKEGDIKIDGISIKDYKIKSLRSLMGNVNQESILFNDTIFNNIAFGVANATEEQVIAAAKVANAHDFIMEADDGYQTNIGDRGGKLSGGQRQRLSIARAVLKNPPILILDEATSALDTESERLVQDALTNLMKNRTSIVIAHRLSTIKGADEICVMHEGKIVERGNHEELIKLNGYFKKLHDLQMF